jgi:hypothetical protein
MKCRSCAREDVPLTVIWKLGPDGRLQPSEGVCRKCTAPPPAEVQGAARVFTALRPGKCRCGHGITPGDRLARMKDGEVMHAGCV